MEQLQVNPFQNPSDVDRACFRSPFKIPLLVSHDFFDSVADLCAFMALRGVHSSGWNTLRIRMMKHRRVH